MQDGITALHIASFKNHQSIVRFLLEEKLDVNVQDKVCNLSLKYFDTLT